MTTQTRVHLSLLFAAAALLGGCVTDGLEGKVFSCTSDAECLSDFFCDQGGACRPEAERGTHCATDADCATGACSVSGTCDGADVTTDVEPDVQDTRDTEPPRDTQGTVPDQRDDTAIDTADADTADADLADADAVPDTPCADTDSDPLHCGECGNVCPSGPQATATCAGGTCGLACEEGWLDCNNNPVDGCEWPWADCSRLVSVSSDGTKANSDSPAEWSTSGSRAPSISSDGRFVAFHSNATTLDPLDTDINPDIYVRDLQTGTTTLVSVSTDGTKGNYGGTGPSISADGRFVAFLSGATNLDPLDTVAGGDIYVRDLQTGTTTLVSVSTDGTKGNGASAGPSISSDGRFVAFHSEATNLDPLDADSTYDIYVHDLQTGTTTLVSVSTDGTKGNDHSVRPSISADGRFVAFQSRATNLDPLDTDAQDIYVRDLQTGTTTLVSVSTDGTRGNRFSDTLSISADGRFVTFESAASNLDPLDTDMDDDVYVRDLQTGTTTLVSVSTDGTKGNDLSAWPSISVNGRFVAFHSYATNLDPLDTDTDADIYVRDLQTGTTTLVSVSTDGTKGNDSSVWPSISADGRFVAFPSSATNLDPLDTDDVLDIYIGLMPQAVVP